MFDSSLTQPEGLPGPSTVVPNDLLARLVNATEAIRDHLTAKVVLNDKYPHVLPVTEHDINPHREEPDAHPERSVHNVQIPAVATSHDGEEPDGWLSADQIQVYTEKCAKHKLKCNLTRESLRCFEAHMKFLDGDEDIIYKAQQVADRILDPMDCLQSALIERRAYKIGDVEVPFYRLYKLIEYFRDILDNNHNGSFQQVKQWETVLFIGWLRMIAFVREREYTECLEYIGKTLLPTLEAAMDAVCEELAAFQEKPVGDWLAKQKYEDLKKCYMDYAKKVFQTFSIDFTEPPITWPELERTQHWQKTYPKHKLVWDKMYDEIGHLIGHYNVVGGDKTVIEAAKLVREMLPNPINRLRGLLESSQDRLRPEMEGMMNALGFLWFAVIAFKKSLYHQKHAFYFREVKQWVDCIYSGLLKLHGFIRRNDPDAFLDHMCNDLFPKLEKIMLGVTASFERPKEVSGDSKTEELSTGNVALELKTFGERSLPNFLVEEMERDTTRFVNITTIATFFSSVTATTLQFTYQPLGNETSEPLRGFVNLFWLVSLVFSVSSGVNSLLGLTWRKSSIYDSRKPPMLIRLWFDKAPMVFLIIAAVAFVIGLNLFAYLSVQPRYVSFATNTFTGLHGICLIGVTAWFIYQLKHESLWARWIRTLMGWVGGLSIWKWVGDLWKWVGDTCKSTWTWVRHPKQEYKDKKLHLKRNIYWAFGLDSRVAQITIDMGRKGWTRDWPGPYILSKLVRFIAHPIKKVWLGSAKILFSIIRSVKRIICTLFHTGNARVDPDVESGKREDTGEEKPPTREEPEEDPAKKASNAYCAVLQEVFHEHSLEREIMQQIKEWQGVGHFSWTYLTLSHREREQDAENCIRRILWGYPDLVQRFHDDVRPVLVEVRDDPRKVNKEMRTEACALGPDAIERSPGPSGQANGGGKGKERAREPEDVGRSGILDFDLTGGRAEVRMRSDIQESTSESQHQAPSTVTNAEGSGRGGVPEIWGGTDGAKEDRSEQAEVEIPGGITSERSANEPSSGPSKSIGEMEKEPGSPAQPSVDTGHTETQAGMCAPMVLLLPGHGGYPEVGMTIEGEGSGYIGRSGAPELICEADGLEGTEETPRIAENEEVDNLRSSEAAGRLG